MSFYLQGMTYVTLILTPNRRGWLNKICFRSDFVNNVR